MSNVPVDDDRKYHDALRKFNEQRRSFERVAVCRNRFVLADCLTKARLIEHNSDNSEYDFSLYRLMRTAHHKISSEPPELDPEHFRKRRRIFYILLELNCPELILLFRRIEDSRLPIDREDLPNALGGEEELRNACGKRWDQFCDRFCEAQARWCPLVFESEMNTQVKQQVIPFYTKDPILPLRDDEPPHEDCAKLYKIRVPAELVEKKLQERLGSASRLVWSKKDIGESDIDTVDRHKQPIQPGDEYYQFALKEFPKSMRVNYDRERKAFLALRQQSGVIQSFGCYESRVDPKCHTYNIILEYADFDLYEMMMNEAPPVSPNEIKSFWESMLELATTLKQIHQVDIHGNKYNLWHGDIKPENILRVQDQFKLADPGEARIQQAAPEDGTRPPKAEAYGGTRTYAAPEKAEWLDGYATDPSKILQNSDVWSLGCVFSVAATYVVLGSQGVIIYNRIRQHSRPQTKTEKGTLVQDAFHDGRNALALVRLWHKYLCNAVRGTDGFTARVLEMVDSKMLVMPPEERWGAEEVSQQLSALVHDPDVNPLPVPEDIEQILQELDLEAELTFESSNNVSRADSEPAAQHLQRRGERSINSIIATPFKSGAALFSTQIMPTAQRSVHRPALLKELQQQDVIVHPVPFSRHMSTPHDKSPLATSGGSNRPRGPDISIQTTPHVTVEQFESEEQSMTYWQVEDELEKIGKGRTLSGLRKSYQAVRGKIPDDPLASVFKDRDIIYLVDNGSSMERHWREATHLLRILVWRSLGYDDDGMELYFTNPDTRVLVKAAKNQDVMDFVSAMNKARPNQPGQRGSKTNLDTKLQEIISHYTTAKRSSAKEKRKTIIILTDGIWEGMSDDELQTRMLETLRRLADLHREDVTKTLEDIRPITFQFVAFGDNQKALDRMRRLDDDMEKLGFPDLIDMEPANGDVYKMFLGSLCSEWDKRRNRANSAILPPSPSGYGPSVASPSLEAFQTSTPYLTSYPPSSPSGQSGGSYSPSTQANSAADSVGIGRSRSQKRSFWTPTTSSATLPTRQESTRRNERSVSRSSYRSTAGT